MSVSTNLMTIAKDPTFQNRVNYALEFASLAVMAEPNSVVGHSLRVAYANAVLAGKELLNIVSIGVVCNSTIALEANIATTPDFGIPDADIQFAVNSIFSALSGVAN
jgi:hypothetical protein